MAMVLESSLDSLIFVELNLIYLGVLLKELFLPCVLFHFCILCLKINKITIIYEQEKFYLVSPPPSFHQKTYNYTWYVMLTIHYS